MSRSQCVRRAASMVLPVLLCSLSAWGYEPTWVPTGVNPGETYHLVFVTSTSYQATATAIGTYDGYADTQGDTLTGSPYGDVTWLCIGSTGASAVTHVNISGPVYRLDDVKVADGSADFWAQPLDSAISTDDTGDNLVDLVWTGITQTGAPDTGNELGKATPRHGDSGLSDWQWAFKATATKTDENNIYAISEALTAPDQVPEPGTILLSLMGLAAGAGLRHRRRRSRK